MTSICLPLRTASRFFDTGSTAAMVPANGWPSGRGAFLPANS
jgi:hypothetical protein